ncbi:hypothetical protein CLV44_12712 [Marinobacterium halophilum]|uniref:Uncharacterized protein n=1 Tax=Marinobacterium halophilum TaxID=267374 RepID=A0A2P8EL99_9GAMM|nr:hypothetical protein [Marinobacterium halophilum]PSL10250.1 hypothetical protein CLV44_12712 [Marinobacterium halophilum]
MTLYDIYIIASLVVVSQVLVYAYRHFLKTCYILLISISLGVSGFCLIVFEVPEYWTEHDLTGALIVSSILLSFHAFHEWLRKIKQN